MQNNALSSATTGFNSGLNNELLLARGGTGKPSLSSIQSQYQVAEDRMIRWEPKLAGFIPSFGLAGNRTMTATEGQMLDRLTRDQGIIGLQRFSGLVDEAFKTANSRVSTTGPIPAAVEAEIKKLPAVQSFPTAKQEGRGLHELSQHPADECLHSRQCLP